MSYEMMFGVRVVATDENTVEIQVKGRSNNCIPHRGDARYDYEKWWKLDRHDHEQIAEKVESIANGYDSGSLKEGDILSPNGIQAYKLYQSRFKKIGIELREPRLSKIVYNKIPRDLFSENLCFFDLSVQKGELLNEEKLLKLAKLGINFPVLRYTSWAGKVKCRLGALGENNSVFIKAPNKQRKGWHVKGGEVWADENFNGLKHSLKVNPYGEPIPFRYKDQKETSIGSFFIQVTDTNGDKYWLGEYWNQISLLEDRRIKEESKLVSGNTIELSVLIERIKKFLPELETRILPHPLLQLSKAA